MKLAIIGSRNITNIDIEKYIPVGVTEIVSGGAKGVDSIAREYAVCHSIKMTEFLPQYERYGRAAPLKRNEQIVDYADAVLVFWDGSSKGTEYTINLFRQLNKKVTLIDV